MCILFCLQEDWKFIVVHKQRRTCKTCIWDNHEVSSQSSRYFIIAPDRHKSYYFQDRTSCLLSPNKKQISRFYSNYSCFRRLSINDVYSILHRPRAKQRNRNTNEQQVILSSLVYHQSWIPRGTTFWDWEDHWFRLKVKTECSWVHSAGSISMNRRQPNTNPAPQVNADISYRNSFAYFASISHLSFTNFETFSTNSIPWCVWSAIKANWSWILQDTR